MTPWALVAILAAALIWSVRTVVRQRTTVDVLRGVKDIAFAELASRARHNAGNRCSTHGTQPAPHCPFCMTARPPTSGMPPTQ